MPRPRREEKTGKASWAPAQMLTVKEKPAEGRLRWVDKDPMNIQKKMAEGWVEANDLNGVRVEHEHPHGIDDGTPLTSLREYRELRLMYLPQDTYEARTAYFEEMTRNQTAGIKRNLDKENADAARDASTGPAKTYGKIVIE